MTIKYELPYSAEIRAKHCKPDDGEQRLLSHEQYNDLRKARKSKGKKNETR